MRKLEANVVRKNSLRRQEEELLEEPDSKRAPPHLSDTGNCDYNYTFPVARGPSALQHANVYEREHFIVDFVRHSGPSCVVFLSTHKMSCTPTFMHMLASVKSKLDTRMCYSAIFRPCVFCWVLLIDDCFLLCLLIRDVMHA